MPLYESTNLPPDGLIGWCHHCHLVQRGEDARIGVVGWADDIYYLCADDRCREPWGLGVWVLACAEHEPERSRTGEVVSQPPYTCVCSSVGGMGVEPIGANA